ncbi:MAG TPA: hypothetical protein VK557_06445 [Pyrinomonadaceae bacterium]|nr:hypothetical protein [Pyrinomonadaceae bacterium]
MKLTSRTIIFCLGLLLIATGPFVRTRAGDVYTRKFDEFSGANWEDAMARLANFALSLNNEPAAIGIIFVYGGQDRRRLEPDAWSACIKDYLVARRGIEATRLAVVLGGYRKNLTVELWEGADKNKIPNQKQQ